MKTNLKQSITFLLSFLMIFILSCSEKVQKKLRVNPEFSEYVSGYTSGVIPKESTIQIQLTKDYNGPINYEAPIDKSLFTFTPSLEGEAYWVNRNTIEFRPAKELESGKEYEVHFSLKELLDVEDENYQDFAFNFKTIAQVGKIYVDQLFTPNTEKLTNQTLHGRLVLTDKSDTSLIKKSLSAFQEGNELPIKWIFQGGLSHRFVVDGVQRKNTNSEVKLLWTGAPFGSDDQQAEVYEVPALGVFLVTNVEVIHEPEQFVRVHFSDPVLVNQNLEGLITVDGAKDFNYLINGHTVSVYYNKRLSGAHEVHVSLGVKNIGGYKLKSSQNIELLFEGMKPKIKLLTNGVIAPHTPNGIQFPFESVNLKAVDVYVTKIHTNNMLQFLQVNGMKGDYQMKRVSKEVYTQTLLLNQDSKLNLHEWNKFYIDLSPIVAKDKGALYQVELRFKKEYSIYGCAGNENNTTASIQKINTTNPTEWTEAGWDSYDYWYDYDYYDYYDDDYDYNRWDDPCNAAYYSGKNVKSNILASDVGIVAKAGGDKIMHVFLNDILTTNPIPQATVEFYNYQQELIGSHQTNDDGMCEAYLEEKPFVIIAKNGEQRGYLKLRDGESLSLSKFDVSGSAVQNGVKGMIYTERGVWRPGDSIYIAFMLEDKNNILPKNHPVTFKLYNPQNQLVDKQILTSGLNGLFDFRTATQQEDVTGNYFAKVEIGNRSFSRVIKVETVKPNRLKVYLDFGRKILSQKDKTNNAKLSVKWLHGAIAKNLKARVNMSISKKYTSFEKFKNFIFDDPIKEFYAEDQVIFESKVDEMGEAIFQPNIFIGKNAPGMLKANFVTKVFEEGGDFSIDRSSIDYSPYDSYVGVFVPKGTLWGNTLVTGKDHEIEVATVDLEGKPLSVNNVDVKVYKVSWKWWWDSYDNSIANYIAKSSTIPILETKVNTSNGKGSFKLRVNQPEWGRYLVRITDPKSGHTTGKIVYIDWPYESRVERTMIENASMLSFSTDKEVYNSNETVKVSFPSPSNGKAIVTVETGTKVLKKYSISTVKGETKFEFRTTSEMSPNVFVHITLLQPHANTLNDAPIRMYGVAPIMVEDAQTHLSPVIDMPEVLKPEKPYTIKVKEAAGKPMTYTLAVVDEGLLDLTSFKTPKPWDHFYAKEALGVKTWDMYDEVMGAFGTQMTKLLAVGGDGAAEVKKPNKANRFKPVVSYIGPFELKAGATATHQLEMPNYIGSVRVMVVAGENAKYGSADKTVPVRSPLMVLGTLPRVLSPTEEVFLPVNVFAMEDFVKDVTVEVTTNDMFTIQGNSKQLLKFTKVGDEVVNFKLKVGEKIGIGKVHIVVKSGNEIAKYDVEMDIRTPNPPVTEVYEKSIKAGESWSPEFMFSGIEGTNEASIEISNFPPINLGERLKYLISYPHGCIEQTTSAVFPQLSLDKVMPLNNDYKIVIDQNIKSGLDRLRLFQTSSGGFAYWPGQSDPNEWGTTYAGHFMLEAELKGYKLPPGLKTNWLKYQKKKAADYKVITTEIQKNQWSNGQYYDINQAYRLYTLALAQSPDLGAMNRLRESKYLTLVAKWRLAAAYKLAGQESVANEMIKGLSTDVPSYKELSYSYGSDIRDEAMILEVLVLMNDAKSAGLAKLLADELNAKQYMSTQTTAYSLLALSKYLGANKTNEVMNFNLAVNGKDEAVKNTKIPVYKQDINTEGKKNNIKVSNNGTGLLYVKLVVTGVPVIGDQRSDNNNVNLYVRYLDMQRNEISPDRIEQGTDFIAEVRVMNPSSRGVLKEMTINHLFPSGWEIHNNRMDGFQSTLTNSSFDFQDIRDDRIYTYYYLGKNATKTFQIQLNATYLGRFYMPTILTEAMYDESISAKIGGRWIEVVK